MADLIVHPEKGNRFRFALPSSEISIGRLATNDLSLQDACCSGRHAAIAPSPGGFVIRDLGSKNGTSVNGVRLTGEKVLKKGDDIKIGNSHIWFEDYKTEVILTPKTDLTRSSNTIIQVKSVVEKHKPPTGLHPRTDRGRERVSEAGRYQWISGILKKVEAALVLHMPIDPLCEYIMDLVAKEIPMDRGVLMLKNDVGDLEKKSVRVFNEPAKPLSIQISRSIVQEALERNVAILISNVQDGPWRDNESIIQKAIHSAMCVPLWDNSEKEEKIIGLIYADRRELTEPFTQDEVDVLALLANMAAVKISNARHIEAEMRNKRMEQELNLARKTQMNLLPKSDPAYGPFDISGAMRPCFQVGGDYFDFIPLGTRLGVLIADVSGKGVNAALQMSQLRGHLHGRVSETPDLGELAAALNEFVHSSSESNTFISFFIGLLDRDKAEITYVNAGHNPPLLLKAGGEIQTLTGTGFCLGMFPSARYTTATAPFGPKDILCAFTDGIVESRNPGQEEYGEERLAVLIRENAGLPAREIKERILESVYGFSACPEAFDDMTLVIVKHNGAESSARDKDG